ncbi:MAG: thioesterase family protein [Candidatus Lokiarchaeota archaeon]
MIKELEEFPLIIEIEVAWGHMDAYQHVNNIMFFQYYESARIAYFNKIGFLKSKQDTSIGPILAKASCKYIAPLKYPDTISVGVKATNLKEDRFNMFYRIISHKSNSIVAEGDSLVVSYDYDKSKSVLLPKNVIQKIKSIEKRL